MKRITGHLEEKNNKYYAAVNHYTADGKRKVKWYNLDLEVRRGNKKEATHRLTQILDKLNAGDIYLDMSLSPSEQERRRLAASYVEDYLPVWLESYKGNVSKSTYNDYQGYLNNRILPFFRERHVQMRDVTGDDFNAFYDHLRTENLRGTTLQRYHALLHLAFRAAVKRRILPSNPVEQADRPKADPFLADHYNADEIRELLDVTQDDDIHLIILLACYYGLRRSEILGLKWSAIDFSEKTISIRHKVLDEAGGPAGYDVMKTKSSYRTMPLLPVIEDALLEEKARQDELRRVMGKSYSKEDADYICVDALGHLYRPNCISDRFRRLLERKGLRHIRFHELRHSCASLLLAQGIPMKMIQDWLGHSDMATTANIYSHLDSASKLGSAAAMMEILSSTDRKMIEKRP